MKWGLDAAFCPSTGELWAAKFDGYTWVAGYVGGDAVNIWTAENWRDADGLGFQLLPIWVAPPGADRGYTRGTEDGNACLVALQNVGLIDVVCLDVEDGAVPREYARGFIDACANGSCSVVLYGGAATIKGIGDLPFEAWWLSFWSTPGQSRPGPVVDWTYWQFGDGPQTDYNVCRDDAPFALLQSPEAPSASPSAEA